MTRPSERSTELVITLARTFVLGLRARTPNWQQAYLRFEADDSCTDLKGSYVTPVGVSIFSAIECRALFDELRPIGCELRDELENEGRKFCLFLLSVNAQLEFNIDYEWEDSTRWNITKTGGASGVPEGLPRIPVLAKTNDACGAESARVEPVMHVVDHEPHTWFLLSDGDRHFLDARVTNSAVDWSVLIELTEYETRQYHAAGRATLNHLAAHINSASSEYAARDLGQSKSDDVLEAVHRWRNSSAATGPSV